MTFDLWTVPVTVDDDELKAGTPEPFVVSDAFEFFPVFSPDGRWIAHVSLEEGTYEIYVRQYPDGARKWRVSDHGGTVAAWSPDGRRLFYETLDHRDGRRRLPSGRRHLSARAAKALGRRATRRYRHGARV